MFPPCLVRHLVRLLCMATNLDIAPDLLEKARNLSGKRTKRAAVELALEEFIRRRTDPAAFEGENLGDSEEAVADRLRQFEALLDEVPDWTPADANEFTDAVKVFEEVDEEGW